MRRLTITFSEMEAEQLHRMACEERRRPRDQAAYLLAQALRRDAASDDADRITTPTGPESTSDRQEVGNATS